MNSNDKDLMDVIEETIQEYGGCSPDMLSAIVYKKVMAHMKVYDNLLHELNKAKEEHTL